MKQRTIKALILLAVGIVVNAVLVGIKMYVGLSTNSLTITLDATNNAFDIVTDIVTVFAFILLFAPKSKKAPFGYGRGEYLAGFIVATVAAVVGGLFFFRSLNRLAMPEPIWFGWQNCVLICVSIPIKIGLGMLYYFFNKKLKSKALKAIILDSFLDAGMTSASAISFAISSQVDYAVDAIFGMIMSIVVVVFAVIMIADNVRSVVSGDGAEDERAALDKAARECDLVRRVVSVVIHDYGFGAKAGVAEIEFESGVSLCEIQDKSREIAKKVFEESGMKLWIVPVSPSDGENSQLDSLKTPNGEALEQSDATDENLISDGLSEVEKQEISD